MTAALAAVAKDPNASKNARENAIGAIAVHGANNAYLGRIAPDGQVYGAKNNYLGKIDNQGGVHGANNALIGKAQGVKRPWAAVYFFFFFK